MKTKVVVLGSLGMAGHIMVAYLRGVGIYEVVGVARQSGHFVDKVLDVTDFKQLRDFLDSERPSIIVNCVGALVSHSATNTASAILLNSYLPHFLSELGRELDFKFIHISTDCVFSGKSGGYSETSPTDGEDNYARSKALGEIINDKDLTIRTSIIGPELKKNGTGLLDWFLKQRGEVRGYSKVFWSGVTTLELAKAVHEMIEQQICGLYQLCPEAKISKSEMLSMFSRIWGREITIVDSTDYESDKSLVCTRHDFKYPPPQYEKMFWEMKAWMDKHQLYYEHYKEL